MTHSVLRRVQPLQNNTSSLNALDFVTLTKLHETLQPYGLLSFCVKHLCITDGAKAYKQLRVCLPNQAVTCYPAEVGNVYDAGSLQQSRHRGEMQ